MEREPVIKASELELKIQSDFIKKIYDRNKSKNLKFHISTYGCQMNAHDSETLEGMLLEMGYVKAEVENQADLVVYNTCCVRENAENKVYGNLGFLKKIKEKNKDFKIVLCGCMMQQDTVIDKIKQSYRFVDVIFGTFNLYRFPELLFTSFETKSMIIDIWQEHKEIIEDLPVARRDKFKASVNIMYGCNNFCTYCIVPYVRGRERSRELEDILKEVNDLAEDGVIEVNLLGQNVNSYGKTLEKKVSFAELLTEISKIEKIKRIRFMTSHPKDLTDDLIEVIASNSKICNYIHLPFQGGSSRLLKKMNRGYTKESYLTLAKKIQDKIPEIGLTTDIIVGFPGETEEDFEQTLEVVKEIRFDNAFTYLYSKRTGTPAALFEEQVDEETAKNRFDRLIAVLKPISQEISESKIGKTLEVLVEGVSHSSETTMTARADDHSLVHFEGGANLIGTLVMVKIVSCKTFYLVGELITETVGN